MSKKLIIGLGTGRCGTMSLANLLNYQDDCSVSHELNGAARLPWKQSPPMFDNFINRILDRNESVVGDVSFYCLPYANFFMSQFDDVSFVILKRERQQTINSYMKKTYGRNHWVNHDGSNWKLDRWDDCYPKFEVDDKKAAIGEYYDLYYKLCKKLPQDKCFWMETPELNDESKCLEMLNFAGFKNPKFKIFKKNEGR